MGTDEDIILIKIWNCPRYGYKVFFLIPLFFSFLSCTHTFLKLLYACLANGEHVSHIVKENLSVLSSNAQSTNFSSNSKLREHIANTRNKISPSRTFKQQTDSTPKIIRSVCVKSTQPPQWSLHVLRGLITVDQACPQDSCRRTYYLFVDKRACERSTNCDEKSRPSLRYEELFNLHSSGAHSLRLQRPHH